MCIWEKLNKDVATMGCFALMIFILAVGSPSLTSTPRPHTQEPSLNVTVTHVGLYDRFRVLYSGVPLEDIEGKILKRENSTKGWDWRIKGCWVGMFPEGSQLHAVPPGMEGHNAYFDQPLTATAPWRFIDCDSSQGGGAEFNSTGKGWYEFTLDAHIKQDFFFALFVNGYEVPKFLVQTPLIKYKAKEAPGHVHIARRKDPRIMSVQWNSKFKETQFVEFRREGEKPTVLKATTVQTYTRYDLCGPPANTTGFVEPGNFYNTHITDLVAGDRYFYRVGNDKHGWSREFSFIGPMHPNPHAHVKAIMLADMGTTFTDGSKYHWPEPHAINTTTHMINMRNEVDLVVFGGDLSYATGYAHIWDSFMTHIEAVAAEVPFMTGKGNHEQDWYFSPPGQVETYYKNANSGGECGVPTDARFHMPTDESNATHSEGWWSLDHGSIHFVMTNTELAWHKGSRHYQWLENDLRSVDRNVTPWIVVFGHRQMYDVFGLESGSSCTGEHSNLGQAEELFVRYKVDLSLYGHIHNAQKTCPMVNGACVNTTDGAGYDAPIHIVIGNAGQKIMNDMPLDPDGKPSPAAFTEYHTWVHGFSMVEAHNATHLTFDFYHDAPLGEQPTKNHTFTLVRGFPRV